MNAANHRITLLCLIVLLSASVLIAITIGPAEVGFGQVWASLSAGLGFGDAAGFRIQHAIIWELRVPRVLCAVIVGGGLALCGAVMQALTRNPLADPYLLGLSSGASVGAVIALLAGMALLIPVGAFLGAAAALILTLGVARVLGGATPSRAILAGIAVSALASAITSLLIFWSATGDSYREILSWLMGSLSGTAWRDVGVGALATGLVVPPMLFAGKVLDAMAFGDNTAEMLGVNVRAVRWVLLGGTALLTGVLVSIAGAIGFVGLVVPHVVRLATGSRYGGVLPFSVLLGALFMLWADTAARTMFDPRELPVGIFTALAGAPVFLIVLMRYRRLT
jgi:iron complex transport system permease protein